MSFKECKQSFIASFEALFIFSTVALVVFGLLAGICCLIKFLMS